MGLPVAAIKTGWMIGKYAKSAGALSNAYATGRGVARVVRSYKRRAGPPKRKKVTVERGFKGTEEGHTTTRSTLNRKGTNKKLDKALIGQLPQVYRKSDRGTVFTTEGTQSFNDIADAWSYADLVSLSGDSTGDRRVYVQGGHIKLVMTNLTSTPTLITIYDLESKEDSFLGSASAAVADSLRRKYGNDHMETYPFVQPSESEEFRNLWKVCGRKEITLSPGEVHVHDYTFQIQRYFDSAKYTNTLAQPALLRFISKKIMVRQQGTPVYDGSNMAYASSRFGWIVEKKYDYKFPIAKDGNKLTGAEVSEIQAGLTSEKYMNEDTGAATVNVNTF